jgi:hypothetical protein
VRHERRLERFMDGHKIDFVKNAVAFDMEWNSKDQTFDLVRDKPRRSGRGRIARTA